MDENLFKIQRGVSTMFIPKKWTGGPSFWWGREATIMLKWKHSGRRLMRSWIML
jgi:hypothetical protein